MKNPFRFKLSIQVLLLLYCLLPACTFLYGQAIALVSDIKTEDALAISFDLPERHETVILLCSPLDRATGWFQAFLLNDRLNIIKRGERIKVDMDVNSAENRVKYMGQYHNDENGYVWWEFSNTFGAPVRGIKLDFKTLNIITTGALEGTLRYEWWGGMDCGGKFYMLGKEKRRKEGNVLSIYPFDVSTGRFQAHFLPVPEGSVFADKQFSATVQKPGRYVSRKHQFFSKDNMIYCLSENENGVLMITLIEPETMIITDQEIENPPGFKKAKTRSILADGKIFRFLATKDACKISIQAIKEGATLFSDSLTLEMPDIKMFNAPVVYVGPNEDFGLFKKIKNDTVEIQGTSSFLHEIDRANELYLYLSISESAYNIRILTNNTLSYGAREAQTVLYTHLHSLLALDKDLTKMPPRIKTDVFDLALPFKKGSSLLFEDEYKPADNDSYLNYPFYTIHAKRYAGNWDKKTQTYTLKLTTF